MHARVWWIGVANLVAPASLMAQGPDSMASPAAVGASAAASKLPVSISGYVTSSYTYSTRDVGGTVVGRLFGRYHDQFMLNAASLVVERAQATDRFDAGFRVEALFGQNAAVVKSAGLDLGNEGDIWQAYVTLNVPTGPGGYVQFKAGKMATLLGVEVVEDVLNPNLEAGNQGVFLENFTNTGFGVDVKFNARFDAQLRIVNGWDVVADNNTEKSLMARLGVTPDDRTTFALLGYYGAEQPDNTANTRAGAEVILSRKIARAASAWIQLDYGEEEGLGPAGEKAKWYGTGLWLTYDLGPNAAFAVRGDYVDDYDGARTSGVLGFPTIAGQRFGSLTATLNVKRWANALVRPEIRYDRSNLLVFDAQKDQLSLGLGLSYIF